MFIAINYRREFLEGVLKKTCPEYNRETIKKTLIKNDRNLFMKVVFEIFQEAFSSFFKETLRFLMISERKEIHFNSLEIKSNIWK